MLTVESLNFKSFLAHPLLRSLWVERLDRMAIGCRDNWGHCAWHDIGDRDRDTAHR
jgi:hypothetical protein